MANRNIEKMMYEIPPEVIKSIQVAKMSLSDKEGLKRANFILNSGGYLNGGALKRIKSDFDSNKMSASQYALAGGKLTIDWIDGVLKQARNAEKSSKNIRQDMHVDVNLGTKAYQTPRLNEEKKDNEEPQKNAVAVIVNNDNKFLLLKRSKESDWMPGKWSLVGGMIEKGENPQQAVEREINEETGLEIEKFVKTFSIQRKPDSIEHIFACRYKGDPTDIVLNNENTNYGWYDVSEMEFLDIVPNLIEYITLSFKKHK
jgi:8-oxo-dGTP pyrophosphatase MutT (NUDIX family)